jgi:hypothetical protein
MPTPTVVERLNSDLGDLQRTPQGDFPSRLTRIFLLDYGTETAINQLSECVNETGVPAIGDSYSAAYPLFICLKKTPRRLQNERGRVEVVCEYGQTPSWWSKDPKEPWELPAVISGGFGILKEVNLDFAYKVIGLDGQPPADFLLVAEDGSIPGDDLIIEMRDKPTAKILNTAGMPFNPSLKGPVRLLNLNIQKNYRGDRFSLETAERYIGTVNSDEVRIAGLVVSRRKALMEDLRFEERWTPLGKKYWAVTYQISIVYGSSSPLSCHDPVILSQGLYQKVDSKLEPIQDSWGRPVTSPVALDVGGGACLPNTTRKPQRMKYFVLWAEQWGRLELPEEPAGDILGADQ